VSNNWSDLFPMVGQPRRRRTPQRTTTAGHEVTHACGHKIVWTFGGTEAQIEVDRQETALDDCPACMEGARRQGT
jgi:hypothetical protein